MAVSEKQDRTFPRTAMDIERKYNIGSTYAEAVGIALDAQHSVEELGGVVNAQSEVIQEQSNTIAQQGNTIKQQGITLGLDDWNFAGVNDTIGGSLLKTEAYCGYSSGQSFGQYSANQINGDSRATISADKITANNGQYITFNADIMMAPNQNIAGVSQIVFNNSVVGAMGNQIYAGHDDHAIYMQAYSGIIIQNLKIKENNVVYTIGDYIEKVVKERGL